jgi:hypothetical protein
MKFQPGQSGNPAGRPPGSRNKKTELTEEMLTLSAQETAKWIVARAQTGDRTAMRLVMERADPTGIDRPLQLELPPVTGPEDLIAAAGVVLNALASGEISSRETVCMLTVVERRREGRRDGPPAGAAASNGAGLYSPVNSRGETSGAAAPEASQAEAASDGLYSPVNSRASAGEAPPPGVAGAAPPSPASDATSGKLQADAAVDDKLEAGDVAALLAREIDGGPGDIEAVAAESHGDLAGPGGPHLLDPAGGGALPFTLPACEPEARTAEENRGNL